MAAFIKELAERHRSASKMLACALQAESLDVWSKAAIVWRARLIDVELAALAYSVLRALDPDHAVLVVESAFDSPNTPQVPLSSAIDEATHWADWADYDSVMACTLTGFNRLSPSDQAEFLRHVTERAAA